VPAATRTPLELVDRRDELGQLPPSRRPTSSFIDRLVGSQIDPTLAENYRAEADAHPVYRHEAP
jgi:hypothetical protein